MEKRRRMRRRRAQTLIFLFIAYSLSLSLSLPKLVSSPLLGFILGKRGAKWGRRGCSFPPSFHLPLESGFRVPKRERREGGGLEKERERDELLPLQLPPPPPSPEARRRRRSCSPAGHRLPWYEP